MNESTVDVTMMSNFTFLETLWTGSFGHIVLALHHLTNQMKTIKLINTKTLLNHRRRVEIEKNIMTAMGSFPFVAKLESFARDIEWMYLIMPMVSVCNLLEVITQQGSLNETTARFFVSQVR